MKICITVNAAWNVLNFRRPLVEALVADGHEIVILAPRDDSVAELEAMGARFDDLALSRKGLNPLAELGLLRRFARKFRQHRPDVVFGFTIKNNLFGALAAARQGVPFIPNVTGLGTAFLSGPALRAASVVLYRFCFRKCPHVFFQNEDDRDLFVALRIVDLPRTSVLPGSGIDLDAFAFQGSPNGTGKTRFLMVSRLLRDKGIMEYVEAAALVGAVRSDAEFCILGDVHSPNRTAIPEEELRRWEREGIVRHLGSASDVRAHVAAADCVVLPSYREGAPRTLIEAAAIGRPVIATDVPGCRAVVDDGVTGYLCEVRNARSLADSMLRFAELDGKSRDRMGMAGREKMEREYSVERVIEAYRAAVAKWGS